jgi:LacI family transcriptional regulator
LALVVPDVTSAVFAELAAGAEREAATRDLAIVLGRAESLLGGDTPTRLGRMMSQSRIDGVILQSPDSGGPADLAELSGSRTPVVVINSTDDGPFSTLVLDDAAGIRTAVGHLCALGHTRIGFVGGLASSSTAQRRAAGFRAGLQEAGLHPDDGWMTDLGYSGSDGRAAVDLLLARGPLPSALVVANLNAALGVLAAIHSRGLRVPADVSIVALHDVWYADAIWPPITTVRMPLAELGAAAVARVVDRGAGVTHTTVRRPEPLLVLRESTSSPCGSHGGSAGGSRARPAATRQACLRQAADAASRSGRRLTHAGGGRRQPDAGSPYRHHHRGAQSPGSLPRGSSA